MNIKCARSFLVYAALLLLVISCTAEIDILENTFHSNQAELIGDSQSITILFGPSDGTASVELKTNKEWEAEIINGRATWCTLSRNVGKRGKASLTVRVTENTTYEERSASIMVISKEAKVNILVIQKQNNAVLLSSSKIEAPESGGIIDVNVRHNIDYDLSLDEDALSWISVLKTKALETSTISLQIAANEDISKREGNILVKSDIGEEVIRVYQAGATPVLILTQNSYRLPAEGGTVFVEIKSNVNYKYEVCEGAEWIIETETKAMSTHTLSFDIKANETYDSRLGRILFSDSESGLSEEVIVVQSQKDAMILSQREYVVSSEGDIVNIEVKSNVNYAYEICEDVEWISELNTKGLDVHELRFVVEPNESYDNRIAKILFFFEESGLSEVVSIIQAQKDVILVNSSTIDIPPSGGVFAIPFKSNINSNVSIPDTCSWIQQLQTKSLSEYIYEFTADKNHSRKERKGVILLYYHEICDTIVVHQPSQPIVTSDKVLYVSGRGGVASFKTATNKKSDYRIDFSDSWLSVSQYKPVLDGIEYMLRAQENPETLIRESYVKVFYQDFLEPDTINVIQMNKTSAITFTTRSKKITTPLLFGKNIQGVISWGDGMSDPCSPGIVHMYPTTGEYTVSIEAVNLTGIQLPVENRMRVDFRELSK